MPVFRVPANITWGGNGSPGVNVWSIRTDEAFVTVDELDKALTALQAFYTAVAGFLASGTVVSVGQDTINRETGEDESRPAKTQASTASTGKAPPMGQGCISWRTPLRARRAMGRTFVGPLSSGAIDTDGTLSTTFVSAMTNAAQGLINASNGANGWAVGVWGLENPGQYDTLGRLLPGQPHVHRDITSFKIRDQFAVLRSRRD